MKNIEGRVIRINGNRFEIKSHILNRDKNEAIETLVLQRPIDGQKPTKSHLNDLGYKKFEDIDYSAAEMKFADLRIKEEEDRFPIAFTTPSGEIKEMKIEICGVNWDNPDNVDILYFNEGKSDEIIVSRKLLLTAYLLYHEWKGDFTPGEDTQVASNSKKGVDNDPDEELGNILKKIMSSVPEIIEESDNSGISFEGEPIKSYHEKTKVDRDSGSALRGIERLKKDIEEANSNPDEVLSVIFNIINKISKD